MDYNLLKKVVQLLEEFDLVKDDQGFSSDIDGFKKWISGCSGSSQVNKNKVEPDWESKENGRSAESVISTMLVHLGKYAKTYSKAVMQDSPFSTQDEFIYLINLKAFGAMGKMELIKMNIQDKPVGMQIINRLIKHNWVFQTDSETDKRSKIIEITDFGLETLEKHMDKIRQATRIVSGDLSISEKVELIRLLGKLTHFHHEIYVQNIGSSELLQKVMNDYLPSIN